MEHVIPGAVTGGRYPYTHKLSHLVKFEPLKITTTLRRDDETGGYRIRIEDRLNDDMWMELFICDRDFEIAAELTAEAEADTVRPPVDND